jgi:hypothetical protein
VHTGACCLTEACPDFCACTFLYLVSHLCALPLLLQDSEDDDSEDERIDQDFVAKMIKRNGLSAGDAQGPKSSKVQELPSEDEEEDSEDDDEDDDEVSDVVCCVRSFVVRGCGCVPRAWEPNSVLRVVADSGGYDVTTFSVQIFIVNYHAVCCAG